MKRASVVISTYNRRDALVATLRKLARQTVSARDYEVVVVDDGSSDGTSEVVGRLSTPYELIALRSESNRGISAGRNLGIRNARGRDIVLLSDDLLVPEGFIQVHVELLAEHPGAWVVGGFRQLDSLTDTPFGRYLDLLEQDFDRQRRVERVGTQLWRLEWPTARNLSMPRADLERLGLFDERFRNACEDQDLAQRAAAAGIRFLYTDRIDCLHNDQHADLRRYCRLQQRGAVDTVRLCRKYPAVHGEAPIARENGPLARRDPPSVAAKKAVKLMLARPIPTGLIERLVAVMERARAPDRLLFRLYRALIGLYIFRGWRQGLAAPP
jgi:GT2 family glycosyltransferase